MKTPAMPLLALALALALACGAAVAEPPSMPELVESELARIETERREAQAQFAREEIACRSRFAVNDCVRRSRARMREMLSALRRQELAINAAQRQRLGAERRRELEQRTAPGASVP